MRYYTPAIEDLFIGYECYQETSWGFIKGTWPIVMTADTLQGFALHDGCKKGFEASINVLKDISKWIQTKYLSKEDIESLGWIFKGKSIDLWFEKEGFFDSITGKHRFTKYILHYNLDDNILFIEAFFGEESQGTLFEGKCPSINELKRIMKLLNIQ